MKVTQTLAKTTLLLICAGACASATTLPAPAREAFASRHQGRVVELRQSCYYGDLYDENEKWLLSPYPFANTYHIVDLNGAPIHPKAQRGIVPAGSKFVIEQVEFPSSWAMAKRMLTTPRYNPWVYLRAVPGGLDAAVVSQPFILILPSDVASEEAAETELNKRLSPEGEVSAWLQTLRPTVQVAIGNKEAVSQMSLAELLAALGEPFRWFSELVDGQPAQVAWYDFTEVWLQNNVVMTSKPGRTIETASPPPHS